MSKLTARKVLIGGVEDVYGGGVHVAGSGTAAHAILASNFTCAPMAASLVKRQRAYQTFGADPSEVAQKYRTIGFDVELAGAGAAGSVPKYGPLLRGCGLLETVNAGVSVAYTPISSGQESNYWSFYWDSLLHLLNGTRGTVGIKAQGGQLPVMAFALSGLYAPVTDSAPADVHVDLENFFDATTMDSTNTVFSLMGQPVVLETLQIDLNNTVIFRDRPNAEYIAITERAVSGTATFEAPSVAAFDWFTEAASRITGALQLTQGTVAGREVSIAAPRVQLGNPTYTDLNGVLGIQVPLMFLRTNGDDELTITVK